MDRPTLEEQLAVKKKLDSMTEQDLIDFFTLKRGTPKEKFEFWVFCHLPIIFHCILTSNWFCGYCGKHHFRFTDKKCRLAFRKKYNIKEGESDWK